MKQRFITGLILVLPLTITFWIISFLVRICTKPFEDIAVAILSRFEFLHSSWWIFSQEQLVRGTSILFILFAIVFILFAIGFISHWLFFHMIIKAIDQMFVHMPIVRRVYKACREFTDVLFSPKSTSFSQVVWAPFPTASQSAIGLVTNEVQIPLANGKMQTFTSVLIPGTPNPTVGFLVMCPKEALTPTSVKIESAMKWVISCGSSCNDTVMHSTHDLASPCNK